MFDTDGKPVMEEVKSKNIKTSGMITEGVSRTWNKVWGEGKNNGADLRSSSFGDEPIDKSSDISNDSDSGKTNNQQGDSVSEKPTNHKNSSSGMSNSNISSQTKQELYRAHQQNLIDKAFGRNTNIGERFSAATEAAEHAGGGKKGALAFGATLLAGTALSSALSPSAEAAEVPVKVKPVAHPANEGMLDELTKRNIKFIKITYLAATMGGVRQAPRHRGVNYIIFSCITNATKN